MMKYRFRKMLAAFLCSAMILTPGMSSAVFAAETPALTEEGPALTDGEQQDESRRIVYLEDHYNHPEGSVSVSDLTIGQVDKPETGKILDNTAVVETAEDESWEIPVLWMDHTLNLAAEAAEGGSYLPVLAFFIPNGYAANDTDASGVFTVTLSEDLRKLFGSSEIISVYHAGSGITYILPASLRGFFTASSHADAEEKEAAKRAAEEEAIRYDTPAAAAEQTDTVSHADVPVVSEQTSPVDIYCSRSAKAVLSREDLEYVVDLIVNKLEPQAVNLILDSFPAFRTAAENGEIGTQIGLYIYYECGDKDGIPAHEKTPDGALAYVSGNTFEDEDSRYFGYFLGMNLEEFTNQYGSGMMGIIKDGDIASDLENTIVHELFHAFMFDYNRTGMVGFNSEQYFISDYEHMTQEQADMFLTIGYPVWFQEGTASAAENVYQYRQELFYNLWKQALMPVNSEQTEFVSAEAGTSLAVFSNYIHGTDTVAGYRLEYADGTIPDEEGNPIDLTPSRYGSGYLAVLYLSELAARSMPEVGSAVSVYEDGTKSFSSEKIRLGLNAILEGLHSGETLDEIIVHIAPKDENNTPIYSGTSDFEQKFICGPVVDNGYLTEGDPGSLSFVTDFLNNMQEISNTPGRSFDANGSILFDFEEDFDTPLDRSKDDSSDTLKIVKSNTYTESTVPYSTALNDGGKSAWNAPAEAAAPAGEEAASSSGVEAEPEAAKIAAPEPEAVPEAAETAAFEPAADASGMEEVSFAGETVSEGTEIISSEAGYDIAA